MVSLYTQLVVCGRLLAVVGELHSGVLLHVASSSCTQCPCVPRAVVIALLDCTDFISTPRFVTRLTHMFLCLCTLADFYGGPSVTERMKPHNYSITSLNIGLNDLRDNALEALINMAKNNAVLRTLVLDLSPDITPRQYRDLASAIRL
jgi:hypothetical protein